MLDLAKRVQWWDEHSRTSFQGESPDQAAIARLACVGRDVLEIGPGEGRQTRIAAEVARCYAVADICQTVLDRFPKFHRYLVKDYSESFGESFDVVQAWYVLHHVLLSETGAFLRLVGHHLRKGGLFVFNYAVGDLPHEDREKFPGCGTTYRRTDDLLVDLHAAIQGRLLVQGSTDAVTSSAVVVWQRG